MQIPLKIKRKKENVIAWCKENNKNIPAIPKYSISSKSTNYFPVYRDVLYLREMKDFVDPQTKAELDSLGMEWENIIVEYSPIPNIVKRINEELKPYIEKHKINIQQIPRLKNEKINPLYSFVTGLRDIIQPEDLPADILKWLNDNGMNWNKRISKIAESALVEFIPYCQQNHFRICDIPEHNPDGKINPMYKLGQKIKCYLLLHPERFPAYVINLLNDYMVVPTENISTKNLTATQINGLKAKLNSKYNNVIKWLDKHLKYVKDIVPSSSCWENWQFILKNITLLEDYQLEDLKLYGYNPELEQKTSSLINRTLMHQINKNDANTYIYRQKVTKRYNKLVSFLKKEGLFVEEIDKNNPLYENLKFVLENINLLSADKIEEFKFYGYNQSTTENAIQ